MQLTIEKLILWPKDSSKKNREIPFKSGKVNVITGDSRSGKSALTAIIDYCLASKSCAIPVGEIRDRTGWFGLHLRCEAGEILVAREEPRDRQSSESFYWIEGQDLELPVRPTKIAGMKEVKKRLNQLARLSDLPLVDNEETEFRIERPSFRDLVAFNFLPQYIVANPYALFYKSDRPDHRKKLQYMFPLALGVDLSNSLALDQERRDLTRRLRPLEKGLDLQSRTRDRWLGDARGLWWRARELGLIASTASQPESLEGISADLLQLLEDPPEFLSQPGISAEAAEHLAALDARESELSSRISSYKFRLERLVSLSGAAGGYGNRLKEQQGRLGALGWFEKHITSSVSCPMCGTEQESALQEIERLQQLASDLSKETKSLIHTPVVVDKERTEIKDQLEELEEARRLVRRERKQAEGISQTSDSASQEKEVYRFLGWLEKSLEDQTGSADDEELAGQVDRIRQRLAEIEGELASDSRKGRLNTALKKVSAGIVGQARLLRLERANEWIELNINNLNLQFTDQTRNRRDVLSDLGSGENWMGYHLATFLALHEHFARQTHSPVANFLVIDQPSQVYFPAQILDEHAKGSTRVLNDKDKEATRRIFETLVLGIECVGGNFQVIVTEHADKDIWGSIKGVELVERWRGERDYLIPREWLI